jgi:Cu-processing system ATP-binding protein
MIRFDNVSKRFDGQVAVDRVTLRVERGEVVALLGPNGSGKTTTLKLAAGLVRPTAGGVWIGEPGVRPTDVRARRLLSFLPQRVAFPESLTGREVVDFYRQLRGAAPERADAALTLAALNGSSGRSVGTYSGGMIQRLGLAVALVPDAPVLLLDEPTAALDPDGLRAFYATVERRRASGQTVFFTSHQLGDAERLADRFAVLVNGALAGVLTSRELDERLSAHGVLRLRLGAAPSDLLDRVRTLVPSASRDGDRLIVPGPATVRPAIVECVRAAGAEILDLTAEEGRLDVFYRELTRQVPEVPEVPEVRRSA